MCTEILFLFTLLVRLALWPSSFDMFGDEVYYTDIGRSVINGGFPRYRGELFFLHGPGFFYLESGWERLAGSQHSLLGWIHEMRLLNALLAAATAAVLVLLAVRIGSRWAGIAAGLLYALEPYCIRQNERVMLETAMMFWVLLGYMIFTSLVGRQVSRGTQAGAVAAGVFFGFAVLTKDEAALLTVLPLLVTVVLRWGPNRALTGLTIVTTVLSYAAYLAIVAANGHLGYLWAAKTEGIRRMLGLIQATGFHSRGGGSLQARLIAEGPYFATTYITLALAVPAAMVILWRGGQLQRMLGLVYCAAAVALGYALSGGTLEEQELYLLIVPSLLVIPVAATLLRRPNPLRKKSAERMFAVPLAMALALVLCINLSTCVKWRRQPDDAISRLLSYMAIHVPPGTRVTTISGGDAVRFALADHYRLGPTVRTPAAASLENMRYVVVSWGEVKGGYSDLTVSQARHLLSRGQLIFSSDERTYGDVALYLLPPDHHARADH